MMPWTRSVFCGHSDTLRYIQQLRAFYSFVSVLHELKTKRLPRLQHCNGQLSCTRHYTWRRERKTKDAPPLYRRKTYYDILKVTPSATQSEIKTAYYKQSFIHHPDKNPRSMEATQVFAEISEAYTVLGNVTLRRKYDQSILSKTDVRGAGKPSSKDSPSKAPGSSQYQQRFRHFTQRDGRPIYDFDAFYKAHYGNQQQREQELKAKKQHMREMEEGKAVQGMAKIILSSVLCLIAWVLINNS